MLAFDEELHPLETAVANTVVYGGVGGVSASESMVTAWVKELSALAQRVEEKGPENSHG
jgi:hypothetical protein